MATIKDLLSTMIGKINENSEAIASGAGGGVKSWNELEDRPFGETTGTSDTVIFDGDITGRDKVFVPSSDDMEMYMVKISDAVPTLEDFQNGIAGEMFIAGETQSITAPADILTDMGNVIVASDFSCAVAKEDNADVDGIIFPTKGIYTVCGVSDGVVAMYVSKFTIVGYTGFTATTVKYIDNKYLEPFETITVGKDTLEWDGNTNGLYKPADTEKTQHNMYLVSDAMPTYEELCNGGTMTVVFNGSTYTETLSSSNLTGSGALSDEDYAEEYVLLPNAMGCVIYKPDTVIFGDVIAEKTGIYLAVPTILQINGYTGFKEEQTKLKEECLPEHLQFGETTVESDTLTWDGDMTGKTSVSLDMEGTVMYCVRVSDVIPTIDDFSNGGSARIQGQGLAEFTSSDISVGEGYLILSDAGIVVSEPNVVVQEYGLTFPETGIYLANIPDNMMYVAEFTINGYKGFKTTGIKKINKKYIPSSGGLISKESDTLLFLGDLSFRKVWGAGEGSLDVIALVKLSDVVPTLAELQKGGAILTLQDGVWSETAFDSSAVSVTDAGCIQLSAGDGYVIADKPTSITLGDGTMLPISEPGIYTLTLGVSDEGIFTSAQGIRINEFTGFTKNEIDNPARIPVYTVDGVKPDAKGNVNIVHPEIPIVKVIEFSTTDGVLTTTEELIDIIGLLRRHTNIVLLKAIRQNPSNYLQYIYYEVTYYDTRPSNREIRFERRNGDNIETIYWTDNGVTIS